MVLLKAIISIVMKRQAPEMKMLEQRAFSISLLGAGQKLLKFRYNRPEKHFFFFYYLVYSNVMCGNLPRPPEAESEDTTVIHPSTSCL